MVTSETLLDKSRTGPALSRTKSLTSHLLSKPRKPVNRPGSSTRELAEATERAARAEGRAEAMLAAMLGPARDARA